MRLMARLSTDSSPGLGSANETRQMEADRLHLVIVSWLDSCGGEIWQVQGRLKLNSP